MTVLAFFASFIATWLIAGYATIHVCFWLDRAFEQRRVDARSSRFSGTRPAPVAPSDRALTRKQKRA